MSNLFDAQTKDVIESRMTQTLHTNATGYGVSDGNTVVGLSFEDDFAGAAIAYQWTAATGMTALPVNRPANYSRANAISASKNSGVGAVPARHRGNSGARRCGSTVPARIGRNSFRHPRTD